MTHFAQQVPEAVVGKGVVDGGDGGAGDQICSLEGWEGGMGWEGDGEGDVGNAEASECGPERMCTTERRWNLVGLATEEC